jgi:hypothetical protein
MTTDDDERRPKGSLGGTVEFKKIGQVPPKTYA